MNELITARSWHRVQVLGQLLGETMTAQYGQGFLDKIEEIRLLAKVRRRGGSENTSLQRVLTALSDDDMISVARAFNQFLNLANIAEQAETTDEQTTNYPEDSTLKTVFERLDREIADKQRIVDTASKIRCELVLTAHPTEITRRTLIRKYNRIASRLGDFSGVSCQELSDVQKTYRKVDRTGN